MMGRGVYFLLVICLVLSLQVQAFHVRPLLQTRINLSKSLLSSLASNVESVFTNPPDEEKSRLRLVLSGDNVCSALFRSDLTRTVVFGRGCAVMFKETKKTEAEVIVEGKTKQIVRFIPWLNVLASEMNSKQRKPNFQGPSLKINIDEASWQEFVGDLKGFQSSTGPPKLDDGVSITDGSATMDSQSMAGTDESV